MHRVDERRRSAVREEVNLALGPPDPTVAIQERDEEVTIGVVQLLDSLKPFGEVVLVRCVSLSWTCCSALSALTSSRID